MKISPIITGSTGMVGEGVLRVCLDSPVVDSILIINRRPSGISHPKIKEVILKDFSELPTIKESLLGYNACYYCAGVSSVGMKKEEYKKVTYDLTMNFAETLIEIYPKNEEGKVDLVFNYVSGAGTDSTEEGKLAWARIKGKLENDLLKLPFKDAYMYRPGYIHPYKSQLNAYKIYKIFSPVYPLLLKLFPNYVGSMEELGKSMINVTLNGYNRKILEIKDIRQTSLI